MNTRRVEVTGGLTIPAIIGSEKVTENSEPGMDDIGLELLDFEFRAGDHGGRSRWRANLCQRLTSSSPPLSLSLTLSSPCLGGSSNSADDRETHYATSSSLASSTSLCFGSVANSPFMNQSAFNPEDLQQILMVKRLRDQICSTTSGK